MTNYLMVSLTDDQRTLIRDALRFYERNESLTPAESGVTAELLATIPSVEDDPGSPPPGSRLESFEGEPGPQQEEPPA